MSRVSRLSRLSRLNRLSLSSPGSVPLPSAALLLLPVLALAGCGAERGAPEPAPEGAASTTLENGSFTVELDGFPIHFEVHGDGPVLMTVPNSWGLSLAGLRSLYKPLEERLTLVYFDPRGMGGSGPVRVEEDMGMAAVRSDFDALRRHLGLDRVHAIGWSNGAGNLILLAAERPEILDSAIFLHGVASFGAEDAADWNERYPDLMKASAAFQQEMADEALPVDQKNARQREMWLGEYFPVMFADPEAGRAKVQEVFAGAELSWPHAAYAQKESPTFDARDRLPAITARSLVVVGAHDMLPPEKGRELADGLADSTFLVFEKSGHFAPVEEPGAFRDAVWEFLGAEPEAGS